MKNIFSVLDHIDERSLATGCTDKLAGFVSATCPSESVRLIRLQPVFFVVFEGDAGGAVHHLWRETAEIGLSGPILSGTDDCAGLAGCLQATENKPFQKALTERLVVPREMV